MVTLHAAVGRGGCALGTVILFEPNMACNWLLTSSCIVRFEKLGPTSWPLAVQRAAYSVFMSLA